MPRIGELQYYGKIGALGQQHALNKPFSDADCGLYFLRLGALFSLLPNPPARLLDCGCGSGWLAHFLNKRGYDVVGTDVAPEAIRLAEQNQIFHSARAPRFLVSDSEQLPFESEFDAVVFFDSLHHSIDEKEALRRAFQALKPGGVCIAVEPGRGHGDKSQAVSAEHDVTEKDMPPVHIRRLGRAAGFGKCEFYPAPDHLGKTLYASHRLASRWLRRLLAIWPIRYLTAFFVMLIYKRYCGITVLHKPAP